MITCEKPNKYYYASFIINGLINLFIINTLNNIEKNIDCKCANNTSKKELLKEWFIFLVFFNSFYLILFLISNYECFDVFSKDYLHFFFTFVLFIIQIVMLVRLFLYIRWLKNECKCSYGLEEKFIYWYLLILFLIIISLL